MSARLLVDVSQFVSYPIPTGIQRTLLQLARHWPADAMVTEFGFNLVRGEPYRVVPLPAFREAVESVFSGNERDAAPGMEASQKLIRFLSERSDAEVTADAIPVHYQGYFMPEITFEDRILDAVQYCRESMGRRCMAIVYDGLPQTHPWYFHGPHQGPTDRYFLTVARVESLALISEETRRVVEGRLRRSAIPNALVMPLGADALGRGAGPAPATPRFIVAGTVEPRKRHSLILDAFESLWGAGRDYRLEFLGTSGWCAPETIDRFRRCCAEQEYFSWRENVTDAELGDAMRQATGAIFVSEVEGYGLPPLEALALGCPVIVSSDMASLEGLHEAGQVRLDGAGADEIAAAVDRVADAAVNAGLRQAAAGLDLPGWQEVIAGLAAWVHDSVQS